MEKEECRVKGVEGKKQKSLLSFPRYSTPGNLFFHSTLVTVPSEQWEIVVDDHAEVVNILFGLLVLMNEAVSYTER